MRIRSITTFFNPDPISNDTKLTNLSSFNNHLRKAIEDSGIEIQSTRIATPPFINWVNNRNFLIDEIKTLELKIRNSGWDYLAIGPAIPNESDSYKLIPEILQSTSDVFVSGIISDNMHVYPQQIQACAEIISKVSKIQENGFTNLRFAALANVPPYAPFFPAAYGELTNTNAFSFAIECADVAVEIFSNVKSLSLARDVFIERLTNFSDQLQTIIDPLARKFQIEFKGFDFSPAPFPEDWCSLGNAFEKLGVKQIGNSGSLAVAAYIAEALDRGKWKKAGFNGLMLAVMEDSRLAKRVAEEKLTIKDLLLYSAVCGTGLDTLPLPGNISTDEIASILLDLGSLATRLGKPLTGRLMPIPNKEIGEETDFAFDFFSKSKIMNPYSEKSLPPILGSDPIEIHPRKK